MKQQRLVVGLGLAILLSACGGAKTPAPNPALPVGAPAYPPTPTKEPPTPLPTPAPETVTTAQIEQRLDPFGSPDCQLPCYNGLTPGDTGLYDALGFYARLGVGVPDLVPGDYQRALTGTGNLRATMMRATDISSALDKGYVPPETNIYLSNGKIQLIYARLGTSPTTLDVKRILTTLGAPDTVGLALTFTSDPNTPTNFQVEIVYTAKQTGFTFVGSTTGDSSAQKVCLNDTTVREVVMGVFAPGVMPLADSTTKAKVLPLDKAAGISTADFVTAASAGQCISIASDTWYQWHP